MPESHPPSRTTGAGAHLLGHLQYLYSNIPSHHQDTDRLASRICVAKSYQAVAGLRVGVGVGEAFIQAGTLYLSLWYKPHELATRGGIFFGMSAVAGAFNGIIAYGIVKNLDGALGWPAWRWLFLIEGMNHDNTPRSG